MVKNKDKPIQIQIAEDDDAEKLREWWKKNGMGIIAGIALGVLGVGGGICNDDGDVILGGASVTANSPDDFCAPERVM